MKIYETRSAIKTFFFLLAIDGTIDEDEIKHFHTIGLSIDPGHYLDYSNVLESECKSVIAGAGDEHYDVISEAVDEALSHEAKEDDQGLTPRLLVWDLFAAAFSNSVYDESERRLINHIARKAGIDKSVVLEMEQMMKTLTSIQNEINWASQANRPYPEIKPIIDELEKRQNVITEAAEFLIADEIDADNPYEYKPDFFDKTKSEIDKRVKPVTDKIGKTVKPVTDKVGATVAPVASKAKEKTGEMFGKLAMKFNRGNKNADNKEGN